MKKTILLLGLLLCSLVGFAAVDTTVAKDEVIHPNIKMLGLKAIKASEKTGDHVYLSVTAYPSKARPNHVLIPEYPEFWPSKYLDKIKDVKIWGGDIKKGESVLLIVSLIEQDNPPWDPDDLVGTVRISVKNNDGKLEINWKLPSKSDRFSEITTPNGKAYKFEMFGNHSDYELYFQSMLNKGSA